MLKKRNARRRNIVYEQEESRGTRKMRMVMIVKTVRKERARMKARMRARKRVRGARRGESDNDGMLLNEGEDHGKYSEDNGEEEYNVNDMDEDEPGIYFWLVPFMISVRLYLTRHCSII
jgi:hypothetical protein